MNKYHNRRLRDCLLIFVLLMVACGPTDSTREVTVESTLDSTYSTTSSSETGYPGISSTIDSAYPGSILPTTEGVLPEPPNPVWTLPPPQEQAGVIGGVLIREITDQGFLPLQPSQLILGEVVYNVQGSPGFIRHNSNSPKATLLATGVFLFTDVPPGTYGLIVDIGVSQFPVLTPEGTELLVAIEPGQVEDLGQVIIEIPN